MFRQNSNGTPMNSLNAHVLAALQKCTHLRHLKQLQAHLLVLGHGRTQFFCFKLLRFCANSRPHLLYARAIFDSLPSPNIFLYTAMITAYSHTDPPSASKLFTQMLRQGRPRPNQFIYPPALRCCSSSRSSVSSLHAQISKTGFHGDGVVQTSLLDAYSRCSDVAAAHKIFDDLPHRSVVSWTAMITGYAQLGMIGTATSLFDEMPERDVPSWNSVIAAYTQNGLFSDAIALFRRMIASSFLPNETTIVCVLSACGHLGTLQFAKSIHAYAYRNSISQSSFVSNSLLDVYGKCGCLGHARRLFDKLPRRSLTHWNSIINCLALHGHSSEVLSVFESMELSGATPDEVTFVGLLNACAHGGLVDEGRQFFHSMERKFNLEPRIEHFGCFTDLLCRAGRFKEVMEVIDRMKMKPDEVIWGSLLNGCRVHGEMEMAEQAVRKLIELDPGNGGYAVLLANLYSSRGKWEEMGGVRKRMKEMREKKLPGCSWIELEGEVRQFYSGDRFDYRIVEIVELLEVLSES